MVSMATEAEPFPGWNWNDPDGLAPRMDEVTANVARCEKLEPLPGGLPSSRSDFLELGLTGIEFAAFKTTHTAGLGTDIVGLRAPDNATEPGTVYVVDGESRFTQLDICEPLPFEDDCVDWVYAEHLIEHVPMPAAIGWLTEIRRILAPGGVVRITTPDLRIYADAYVSDSGFFAKHRRRLRLMRLGPPMPERKAFMINQIFYLYGHRWIYDFEELRYVFAEAGFDPDAVRRCAFRQGERKDVADLDVSFRSDETIYVEVTA
jgi:predicted SAM-dependent methyltransferase